MADPTVDNIEIIRTKLFRPTVPKDHFHRQHLIELLDHGRELSLPLVSTPAGYEKPIDKVLIAKP